MRPPITLVTVAETAVFTRQAAAFWNDEEREGFVDFIAANPEAGDVVQGTGGVRKVRWSRAGTGKRGGTRVIYFYGDSLHPLYLLLVYAKAEKTDLNAAEKRKVRELADHLKSEARGGKRDEQVRRRPDREP